MARPTTPKPHSTDLFGEQAVSVPNPEAYGGTPGGGPIGRQCRHCYYYTRIQPRRREYRKCGRIRSRWTADARTDIKASTPACEHFHPRRRT